MSRFLAGAGLLSLLAGPVAAQMSNMSAMPESYRQVQLSALALQRRVLLAMADSMPEQFYRDKVTPIQRDFAQQIEHAAGSLVYIVSSVMKATPPAQADTAAYLNSKAGLKGFINTTYDWAGNVLKIQTAAQREAMATLFGKSLPTWQVWDEVHQHTFWTAGQVVANFRKHGMAPPGFGFF